MPKGIGPKEPAPFFFVEKFPLAQVGEPAHHHAFEGVSGRLKVDFEVVSQYLHVGSGILKSEIFERRHLAFSYHAFTRRNGRLVIPGTSLKGAVRSYYEALTNSCPAVEKMNCVDEKHLCPACRLFGTTGYGGRVSFSDAVVVGKEVVHKIKIPDLWPPKHSDARKFYYIWSSNYSPCDIQPQKNHRFVEAVPRGTVFRTTVSFENLSGEELVTLLMSMGVGVEASKVGLAFHLKVGGAKPRCLGAIRVKALEVRVIDCSQNIIEQLTTGGTGLGLKEVARRWGKGNRLVNQEVWKLLKKNSRLNPEKHCPKGVY